MADTQHGRSNPYKKQEARNRHQNALSDNVCDLYTQSYFQPGVALHYCQDFHTK